jgi:hypothetical protein
MEASIDIGLVAWVVTKDHINPQPCDRTGYGQTVRDAEASGPTLLNAGTVHVTLGVDPKAIPVDKQVRWKSYDDDGELYYEGRIHVDALFCEGDFETDDDTDLGYELDRFCEADAGAVRTIYNAPDIAKHKPEFAERHRRSDLSGGENWLEIYG